MSVKDRKCGFSAAITVAVWKTNKSPASARTYLEGLGYVDVPVISTAHTGSQDEWDETDSQSGGFAEVGMGHHQLEGEVKLQFKDFNRPPKFKRGEIRALRIFHDFAGTGLVVVTPGAENLEFMGFVKIQSVAWSDPQRGPLEVTLRIKSHGFFVGDLPE